MVLDCETDDGCKIPQVSEDIKRACALRQDLNRLDKMGFPDKYKEEYVKREHAPDIRIMQLSMLADEYIEELQKKRERKNAHKKNTSRT